MFQRVTIRLCAIILLMALSSCTGQDRVVQQDKERGIVLRYTNVETVGPFGEPGVGGTAGSLRLEYTDGFYPVRTPEPCLDNVKFDASFDPVRIECNGKTYGLYKFGRSEALLGPPGEFRPMHEAADVLVKKGGQPVLKAMLTEAHSRKQMVEFLITLGDTDCGQYWDVSFEGLSTSEQKRVRDGLAKRPGASELRSKRLN